MKYTMQNGKTLLIVSGGSIDINFSKEYIKDKKYGIFQLLSNNI